ncbi:MAG: hypothetical protein ABSF33_19220 [Acidimicrobiales bacterium]|jgi:hypothetical protein
MPSPAGLPDHSANAVGSPAGTAGCFSCVVDDHPRFHLDAIRWFTALTVVAGVDPHDLVVHVVGRETSDALDYLRAEGVTVRPVERFDPRSPHCNKIAGALRLAEDARNGIMVLCDTDVVVLDDPRGIPVPPDAIAGKPVDSPVPPYEVILAIFDAAGVGAPPPVPLPWGADRQTVRGNSNGGLYLIPGPLLSDVALAWARWARWLLDRAELLSDWTVYIDQVAMAIALAATGTGSMGLDVRWNTPTHDPTTIPAQAAEPSIIHYHQQVDLGGRLLPTGVPSIDGRISTANHAIDHLWPDGLPKSTYEEWLSLGGPDPTASGTGATTKSAHLLGRGRRILAKGRRGRH